MVEFMEKVYVVRLRVQFTMATLVDAAREVKFLVQSSMAEIMQKMF